MGEDLLKLRRATVKDIPLVWGIVSTGAQWLLKEKNLNHWSLFYTKDVIAHYVQEKEAYVGEIDNVPVATITLDTHKVSYFTEKDMQLFEEPEAPALYISALAVLPEYQGKGIARSLLAFADEYAKEKGLRYIRIDCRAEDTKLVSMYEHYNFVTKGTDYVAENDTYLFMEKKIPAK